MIFFVLLLCGANLVHAQAGLPVYNRNCTLDCNTKVCNPCTSVDLVDFVFLIDGSSSMQTPIDSVRNGLTKFTDEIIKRDVDARYMIAMYGVNPEIILDWVTDGYICRDALAQVRAAEVNNFQGPQNGTNLTALYGSNPPRWLAHMNHDCVNCNTRESSFEIINMVLGRQINGGRNILPRRNDSRSAQLTGAIQFRANATKFIIAVTNEDSDCPYYEVNRWNSAKGRQCGLGENGNATEDGAAAPTGFSPPSPFPLARNNTFQDNWIDELEYTAQQLIQSGASLMMWVDPTNGASIDQFGDPNVASQTTNFTNYNATATLANLTSNNRTKDSFQARVLRLNITTQFRLFDLRQISDNSVSNFFDEVIKAVDRPDCNLKKRAVDDSFLTMFDKRQAMMMAPPICVEYRCLCAEGCTARALCNPGCQQCSLPLAANLQGPLTCVPDGFFHPTNSCLSCDPRKSKSAWSTCDDLNPCTTDYCMGTTCRSTNIITAACGWCMINGTAIPRLTNRDQSGCEVCEPETNFNAWTRTVACTNAPTPAPPTLAPPTPAPPTPMPPTPMPTPLIGAPCANYSSCKACREPAVLNVKLPCKWCFLPESLRDDDGICQNVDQGCFASGALSTSSNGDGMCPTEPPTPMPTPMPTPNPTPAPTPMPTPATPSPTPDPALDLMCTVDMNEGDRRMFTNQAGEMQFCVCAKGRYLVCQTMGTACPLLPTRAECVAKSQCCWRNLAIGGLCLDSSNNLCKNPPPGSDGEDITAVKTSGDVTATLAQPVTVDATRPTTALLLLPLATAIVTALRQA